MKIKHIVLLMIFVAATIASSQPKLALDTPEVNFGSMFSGSKKKSKFTIKNIGNEPLKILSIHPECGCTAVKQPRQTLLPDETDVVELEFNSARYAGKVEKHVTINTNDPTSPYVSVKLLINVLEILHPIKGSYVVWIDSTIIGRPKTQSMSFINVSGKPLAILRDSVSSSALALKSPKRILQPNDSLTVQITATTARLGYYANEHVDIITDNKTQPVVEIQVTFMGIQDPNNR